MRPRAELAEAWGAVLGSKAADSNRLQCLKVRTGYPESSTCFPDDTPKSDVSRGTNFLAPDMFGFLPVPHGGSFSVAD